jgi:hypothetical protein
MKRVTRSRALLLVALVLTVVTIGSVTTASAYWTQSGGGSGAAQTSQGQSLTLTPATPTAQLYPGGQAAVALTISNPSPADASVGSLALDTTQGAGGFAVDAGHAACALSALSFATQTNGGSGWTVPGGGTVPVTLAGALSMTSAAANACQGATFTVYLRATP